MNDKHVVDSFFDILKATGNQYLPGRNDAIPDCAQANASSDAILSILSERCHSSPITTVWMSSMQMQLFADQV